MPLDREHFSVTQRHVVVVVLIVCRIEQRSHLPFSLLLPRAKHRDIAFIVRTVNVTLLSEHVPSVTRTD